MTLIAYKTTAFRLDSIRNIHRVNGIIEEYRQQGFSLTLRQVYYQMVARGYIPNNDCSYKALGSLINDARLAGEISWDSIEDRLRNLAGNQHWRDTAQIIRSCEWIAFDKWEDQDYHVEVWVEKDALSGVVGQPCRRLDIDYFSCRGYVSQSEMWKAAQRLMRYAAEGKICRILHLGDHDPSGIDMSRDIEERIRMFWTHHYENEMDTDHDPESSFEFERIALNSDQVQRYNPPPNPAKITDSRCAAYIDQYSDSSWELDALEPNVIADLITEQVDLVIDQEKFDAQVARQEAARNDIRKVSRNWGKVAEYARAL